MICGRARILWSRPPPDRGCSEEAHRHHVLVSGSREWADRDTVYQALDAACLEVRRDGPRPIGVIHGDDATGVGAIAHTWALRHPARWREHGGCDPQAGPALNRLVGGLGAGLSLAFIRNGSSGASHCAGLAEEAGIPTRRYTA
ncbi:SLOG family protein [Streptomyces sp. NPDC035033]|uniref:SLOG family protein n=1 Tax=Streptomyces sp. NPDC035033 TaxID=3155368 RepID=UPI0033C72D23